MGRAGRVAGRSWCTTPRRNPLLTSAAHKAVKKVIINAAWYEFDKWIGKLKDRKARGVILARINRLYEGLEGDIKPVGKGVSELRVHFGPGYRVYLTQRGDVLIIVLCAGQKKTQQRDIARAQALAKGLEI